jgi:hypothetical protein
MKKEANPVTNRALQLRAEQAALEAYHAAKAVTARQRAKLMDRAATRVFKAAGTPRDAAEFYSVAVTALVLARINPDRSGAGASPP